MSIGNLDLNLMLALDALLREASVTRAAERLNLTQPTVSASLARLRRHFDDELLRRSGNQLELTPLALRLRPLVEEALGSANRVFTAHAAVDPARSTRRFSILASDYGLNVVGAKWSGLLARSAPRARLAFSTLAMEQLSPPEVRMRDVDGVLAPEGFLPETIPHIDLFVDRWVVVADESNAAVSAAPTLDELAGMPWASAFEGPLHTPAGIQRAEWAYMTRQIGVVVDTFAALPLCVRGTNRVALMQERLVQALDAGRGLRILEPPVKIESFRLAFWWHPAFSQDSEHRWLRALLGYFRQPSPGDSSPT